MESLANRIERRAREVASLHHRLVLVVGPPGSGKTTALRKLRDRTDAPLVNASLELSRRMLELTERQRALRLAGLLGEIVDEAHTKRVEAASASDPSFPAPRFQACYYRTRPTSLVVAGWQQDHLVPGLWSR